MLWTNRCDLGQLSQKCDPPVRLKFVCFHAEYINPRSYGMVVFIMTIPQNSVGAGRLF